MRAELCCLATLLTACAGATDNTPTDGTECGAPYTPFDAANYEPQLQRVGAYEQIVAIRKDPGFAAADFDLIESLYDDTADLSDKVAGRGDDHSYGDPAIGVTLDADIRAAIAAGRADDDIAVQGQIVDKTLQRFFYLSVFHEGTKATDDALSDDDVQKGWDEAFGYFGLAVDGSSTTGLASTLDKRDVEFGTSLVDGVYGALLDGNCALSSGDRAGAVAARDTADADLLDGLVLSVVHEMDTYADDPLIKGWEGLLYWRAVADHVGQLDPTARAAIDAEFALGPDQIDPAVVRSTLTGAVGLAL